MSEKKRYEILEGLPVYGPMYIPVAQNGELFFSEGFPVRFYRSDNTEWVANFKTGITGLSAVFELKATLNLLVIAYGICYIINPDNINPVSVFGLDYEWAIVAGNRIVLQDQTGFTIVEEDGAFWHTDRISWDGLKEVKLNGNIITGVSYNPTADADEWVRFSFNIDTKEVFGGSFS